MSLEGWDQAKSQAEGRQKGKRGALCFSHLTYLLKLPPRERARARGPARTLHSERSAVWKYCSASLKEIGGAALADVPPSPAGRQKMVLAPHCPSAPASQSRNELPPQVRVAVLAQGALSQLPVRQEGKDLGSWGKAVGLPPPPSPSRPSALSPALSPSP